MLSRSEFKFLLGTGALLSLVACSPHSFAPGMKVAAPPSYTGITFGNGTGSDPLPPLYGNGTGNDPSPWLSGGGSDPTQSPSGSGADTNPLQLPVSPQFVCGPQFGTPSSQSLLVNTQQVAAVLFKAGNPEFGNFAGQTSTSVVQAWDTPSELTQIRAELMAGAPFNLALNQPLSPGLYELVMFDATKQKAPYNFNWQNSTNAVAPIMDSVVGNLDYTAQISVNSSGLITNPASYQVLLSLHNDPICQTLNASMIDPLMINFDWGPVALSSQQNGIQIDWSGFLQKISWPIRPMVSAFLVNDPNDSSAIGPNQVFGNYTVGPDGQTSANGYDALRKYDASGTGTINNQDPIWSALRLWSDDNRDGNANAGELFTLDQAGIVAIHLPSANDTLNGRIGKQFCRTDRFGNLICQGQSAFVTIDKSGEMQRLPLEDVSFKPTQP